MTVMTTAKMTARLSLSSALAATALNGLMRAKTSASAVALI